MAIIKWNLQRLIVMICEILLNNFDCFITVEGNRGLGKSTLAYHIAKRVRLEMKRRGRTDYKFVPRNALLYKRKDVIKFFNKWRVTGIADEMINVSFNRDFYNEDQKDLIKMINMNRDHFNLFIACIPQFQNLDNQVKNLCKIRLSVVRRGLAIIQTPNKTIYGRDKWDQAINEKIERKWIEKNTDKPHYSKLTTFRGLVHFPKLTARQEEKYQKIKNEKRNEIYKDKYAQDDQPDPYDILTKKLIDGKIKNKAMLEGISVGMEISTDKLQREMKKRLEEMNLPTTIAEYYWDIREKKLKKSATLNKVLDEINV